MEWNQIIIKQFELKQELLLKMIEAKYNIKDIREVASEFNAWIPPREPKQLSKKYKAVITENGDLWSVESYNGIRSIAGFPKLKDVLVTFTYEEL